MTIAINAPPNAKPGGKVKIKAPNGGFATITFPDDVVPGQQIKVQVPRHPEPEPAPAPAPAATKSPPTVLPPLADTDALRAAAQAGDPSGALMRKLDLDRKAISVLNKRNAEKNRELAEEERYADQAEHIESINTVAAWLLMPAVHRPHQSIKHGGKALKGGWLGHRDMAKYLFLGIFFTFLQCFVVTAMIMDVTVQNAIGEYGDGMLEQIAEAAQVRDFTRFCIDFPSCCLTFPYFCLTFPYFCLNVPNF